MMFHLQHAALFLKDLTGEIGGCDPSLTKETLKDKSQTVQRCSNESCLFPLQDRPEFSEVVSSLEECLSNVEVPSDTEILL